MAGLAVERLDNIDFGARLVGWVGGEHIHNGHLSGSNLLVTPCKNLNKLDSKLGLSLAIMATSQNKIELL